MSSASTLPGHWHPLKAFLSGAPAPELVITKTQLHLRADGTYTIHFAGELAERGRYQLDGPEHLTFHATHGPNAPRALPGIYQLVGDRLRLCFALSGPRPTAFASAPESEHYLISYRRAAPLPPVHSAGR